MAWKPQCAAEGEGQTFRRAVAVVGLLNNTFSRAGQRNIRWAEEKRYGYACQCAVGSVGRKVLGKQITDADYSGI